MRKAIAALAFLMILQAVAACTITSFTIEEAAEKQHFYAESTLTASVDFNGACDGNLVITNTDRLSGEAIVEYNSPVTGPLMTVTITPSEKGIRRLSAEFVQRENAGAMDLLKGGIVPPQPPPTDVVILESNSTFILNWVGSHKNPMSSEYGDFNMFAVIYNRTPSTIYDIPITLSAAGGDLNILSSFDGDKTADAIIDLGSGKAKPLWWYAEAITENVSLTLTAGSGITELSIYRDVNSAPIINLTGPQSGDYNFADVDFDYTVTNQNDVNYCELIINGQAEQADHSAPFGTFQKTFEFYGDALEWDINCVTVGGHDYPINDGVEFDSNNGPRAIRVVGFGGSGSQEDPYKIDTCGELQSVRNFLEASFLLVLDINCAGTAGWNSGKGFEPIGWDYDGDSSLEMDEVFAGTLDGNRHAVKGMNITRPEKNRVGLIGYLDTLGVVKRLGLENASVSGSMRVGALVGENYGTVTESYSTGNVYGVYSVGGLVGNNASTVEKSYSDANVTADAMAWGAFAGGLVGWNLATITNTYATGTITSDEHGTAGLVGANYQVPGFSAVITNSYSTGEILAAEGVGLADNIVGSVSNSFWDTNTSGKSSGAGTGKFTGEMMRESTFTGWDFGLVWAIDENTSYPYFHWQN